MKKIYSLLEDLNEFFRKNEEIKAVIYYGDTINRPDYFKNFFITIYSDNFNLKEEIFSDIKYRINDYFDVIYEILEEDKISFFTTRKERININFKFKNKYYEDVFMLERENFIIDEIVYLKRDMTGPFFDEENYNQKLINSFLNELENFFLQLNTNNVMEAYLIYSKLINIVFNIYSIEDKLDYDLWYKDTNKEIVKDIMNISEGLDINLINTKIYKLIDFFMKKIENDKSKKIERVVNYIRTKYPIFFNFRDISSVPNEASSNVILNDGYVFRSSSLSNYDEVFLESFMTKNNIKKIIDLRGEQEIKRYIKRRGKDYSDNFKEKYVVNLYMNDIEEIKYYPDNIRQNNYYHVLKEFRYIIGDLFKNHISKADEEHFIIHCETGKDRTGIVIAILLDLLGIDKSTIVKDYLKSFQDVKKENIEFVIDKLNNEFGGSENYLIEFCNVDKSILDKIKKIFILI